MYDRVASEDSFLIVYCPNKYITQKLCDESVDDSLATLKLIPNWFVTSKMIKNIFTALYADEKKILLMLLLIVMKWVFLILILIILILMIILMKMILILLFMSDY